MTMPKKGSRIIVVDGSAYRWLIRRRDKYDQVCFGIGRLRVAIERNEKPNRTLLIYTDRPHPHDLGPPEVIPITPSDISNWIHEAIKLGWAPNQSGPQMHVIIEEGRMMTQKSARNKL